MKSLVFALAISAPLMLQGCGNLNCALTGDNVKGHLIFTGGAAIQTGGKLLIEFSKDAFTTTAASASVTNTQGFAVVPYSGCLDPGTSYSIRAFQDSNQSGTWDSGELAGRDDGSSSGNGTYLTRTVATSSSQVISGVDIYLDSTGGQ